MTDDLELLSDAGMQALNRMIANAPQPILPALDTDRLLRYLASLLPMTEARIVERALNASPTTRRDLIRTQSSLRQLRLSSWYQVAQLAEQGDKTAIAWHAILREQTEQMEQGRILWHRLPVAHAWQEIRTHARMGMQQARVAWIEFLNFGEQWKALRRLESMSPASVKSARTGKSQDILHRPESANSGVPETIEIEWAGTIDSVGDLVAGLTWTEVFPSVVSFGPQCALLSMELGGSLWPLELAEVVIIASHTEADDSEPNHNKTDAMESAPHPTSTVEKAPVDFDTDQNHHKNAEYVLNANWSVPGFGAALAINEGRIGPNRFRVDLVEGSLEEVRRSIQAGQYPLPLLTHSSVNQAEVPSTLLPSPLVVEVFTSQDELSHLPPLILSIATPPVWQAPVLTLEFTIPRYAYRTYEGFELVLEAAISEKYWQRLGHWPVTEWPRHREFLTISAEVPGASASLLSTPLRARLIGSK